MTYPGFTADTAAMRSSATGFTSCADDLEKAGQNLGDALADESFLGGDKNAHAFRQNYDPVREFVFSQAKSLTSALHGIKGGVDEWSAMYERADSASTVRT